MEALLHIVTINDNDFDFDKERNNNHIMDQSKFPFYITDFIVTEDSSGYVYIFISTKCHSYTYIGKTTNIIARLCTYNSKHGSKSSEPPHLQPYSLFAFICGFNVNNSLMLYIEQKWKQRRDALINQGNNDLCEWENVGNEIANLDYNNYTSIDDNDLRLVKLFR